MRLAYKAFEPGLICRGVKFNPIGVKNVTEAANCARNGWHCAENPADCLTYYPNIKKSVYTIVGVEGDTDEDASDSKISCTELTILRILSPIDFFLHILIYMIKHPKKRRGHVMHGRGTAQNGYVIVCGLEPKAKGRLGDILAMARTDREGNIEQIAVFTVDGEDIPEGVYINIEGRVEADENYGF